MVENSSEEKMDQAENLSSSQIIGGQASEESCGCADDGSVTEKAVEAIQAELEAARKSGEEFKAIAARAQADLINLRNRSVAERAEIADRVRDGFALMLCDVIDDFTVALEIDSAGDESWLDGFRGIYKNLLRTLTDQGYRSYEAVGMQFDPLRHEAVEMVPTLEMAEGTVVRVLREGYERAADGKVLRPAFVALAKNPELDD